MRFPSTLLLCYLNLHAGFSFALGLSDADLKSHLGEPLAVSVAVNDVEKSPEISCFSVTDTSETEAFRNPALSLKSNNSGYQLNISTHNAITEPIINLSIAYQCEPNFKRDYVLLLDPAPLSNTMPADKPATSADATNSAVIVSDKKAARQTNINSPAEFQQPVPIKKKKRKSKSNNTPSVEQKLMDAYTGADPTDGGKKPEVGSHNKLAGNIASNQEISDKNRPPQLVISGGANVLYSNAVQPNLTLRLEKEIDFSRTEVTSASIPAEIADEVTVMANRLAHLEKQIVSLQSKNQQLLAETEKAKSGSLPFAGPFSGWLQNALVGLLVCAALVAVWQVRRRIIRERLIKQEASWFDASASAATIEAQAGKQDALDASFFGAINDQGAPTMGTLLTESIEGQENILDNAEVFILHDRPELAIQLLQSHLIDYPSESPKIWLKLLSLLAAQGSEADYENVATECKHFFNIRIPNIAEALSKDNSSIEEFPHIMSRLLNLWGSPYVIEFLDDLIYNQQSQPREGFSRGTFEELFFLKELAQTINNNSTLVQSNLYPANAIQPNLDNVSFNDIAFEDIVNNDHGAITSSDTEVGMLSDGENVYNESPPIQQAEPFKANEIDFFSVREDIANESTPKESPDKKDLEADSKKSASLIEWDLPK